jgi:hypothetical protein
MKAEFVEGSGLGDDESVSMKCTIKCVLCPFLEYFLAYGYRVDFSAWRNKANKGMKTLSNRSAFCLFLIDDNYVGHFKSSAHSTFSL